MHCEGDRGIEIRIDAEVQMFIKFLITVKGTSLLNLAEQPNICIYFLSMGELMVFYCRYFIWLLLSRARLTWSGWQDNLRPRMFLQPRLYTDYQIFEGNKTDPDNFEVILLDGDHVLVGGRNTVYKLQLRDLKLRQLLEWNSSEQDKSVCLVKGKSEPFCQNYIKVLKKFENDEGRYLICGTNAFKPECREYVEDAGSYLMTKKSKGVGKCPYSPEHNSTSVLVEDRLYAGTAADYQVRNKHNNCPAIIDFVLVFGDTFCLLYV